MLEEGKNNYIACVACAEDGWAVAFCDISTGAFYATDGLGEPGYQKILIELGRFSPAEVLLEAKLLAAAGYREVVLTGIHLSSYGLDFPEEAANRSEEEYYGTALRRLIGEIAAIPTAPAVQGAYYALDGVFRTKLPLENTWYRKKKN
jgi:DNA mismatch repair ATPase MutS